MTRNPFEDIDAVGTSFHQKEVTEIFERQGMPLGGVLWIEVRIVAESDNEHDANAIAVLIEDVRVAHISRKDNVNLIDYVNCSEVRGDVILLPARVWALKTLDEYCDWKCRITLDPTEPRHEFTYVDENFWVGPNVARGNLRRTPLAVDNWMSEAVKVGFCRGMFFEEHHDAIESLVSSGDISGAIELLTESASASIRFARQVEDRPELWPTDRLAKLLRKARRFEDEVRVLEDYLEATTPARRTKQVRDRLRRAYQLTKSTPRQDLIEPYIKPPATPYWEPLVDPLPLYDIPIREASLVWNQDEYAHLVHKILDDNSISQGDEYATIATLREDGATWEIHVFVDGWRIGHVSAEFSADIRPSLRNTAKRGFDGTAHCTIALVGERRTVTLRPASYTRLARITPTR